MKPKLSETICEIGRKGELEQDKLFCLLLQMQEKLRQELSEDPTYRRTLDLERLQSITTDYRAYIQRGRDLIDQLTGWLKRAEQNEEREGTGIPGFSGVRESDYPMDALYHMAVAEQEQELQHLHTYK